MSRFWLNIYVAVLAPVMAYQGWKHFSYQQEAAQWLKDRYWRPIQYGVIPKGISRIHPKRLKTNIIIEVEMKENFEIVFEVEQQYMACSKKLQTAILHAMITDQMGHPDNIVRVIYPELKRQALS
jgi:hypothetical protein